MDLWQKFCDMQAELSKLYHAIAVLSWDQQTYMPVGGSEARAESLAYLQTLAHEKLISSKTKDLIYNLEYLKDDPEKGPIYNVVRREYEKAVKIPIALVTENAKTTSLAIAFWQEAKQKGDFSIFATHLEKVVTLQRQKAEVIGYDNEPYDALIDLYEPGIKTKDVEVIFKQLKEALIPLVMDITARQGKRPDLFNQDYAKKSQWDLGLKALQEMGFDFNRGRQDYSEHPFTISFDPSDVRITTNITTKSFPSSLYSSMHEGGHALYEQGIPEKWRHLAIGKAASIAVHESQSRMWENIVGRSKEYLSHLWPHIRTQFALELQTVDFDSFYQAINWVEPSLIRVNADEVTYDLHIFIRFELERDLLAGKLSVSDLPKAWDEKVESYLGIKVPNPAEGVLQDVHWAMGSIGYFPTYTLGNVIAAQFYQQARHEIPDLSQNIAVGNLSPLREWLREKIHQRGSILLPLQLLEEVCGSTLSVKPYLDYLKEKYLI